LPSNVALMQLAMTAETADEVEAALRDASHDLSRSANPAGAARLDAALALWQRLPNAFTTVKQVLHAVDHSPAAVPSDQAVARCAAAFDQAAGLASPASAALYSLGDADLLEAATREVARRLAEWDLLRPDRTLLDFGCGSGRFLRLLAPRVRFALGLDISLRMLRAARRDDALPTNSAMGLMSGHDLSLIADACIDLVCAIDVFPYLVQCGGDLAPRQIHEAVRVLRPGGYLVIVNYSYRGSLEADRSDIARIASETGLSIERDGTRDFTLWDGATFLLRKPGAS
jgi:hypothetical protein